MYILVSYCILFHCAPSVWRAMRTAALILNEVCEVSRESQAKAHALLTAKWKYFHGSLTFTDGEYTCEL